MAWRRQIRLIVVPPGASQGLEFRELFVEFDVTRSIKFGENVASFTIHNVNATTRNDILVEGASVEFYAGYEDAGGPGLIFKGNVIKVDPEKTSTGYVVTIDCATIKKGQLDPTKLSLSYAADSALTDIINEVAAQLGLVVYGAENAAGITLPNGFAAAGSSRAIMANIETLLKDNGLGVYRDNDELVVFKQGEASFFEITRLTYTSGLIEIAPYEETKSRKKAKNGSSVKDGIPQRTITALLFYQIRPNGLLEVADVDSQDNGRYIPTIVNYTGDNENGPFNCLIRADKV